MKHLFKILLWLPIVAIAQPKEGSLTYYFDPNWQRVTSKEAAEYIRYVAPSELFFEVQDFYANEKPAMTGQFKSILDTKKGGGYTSQVGKFVWYYPNGTKKAECTYKFGKLEGKYSEYYASGKAKDIGEYESGKRTGVRKEYDAQGKLLLETDYTANSIVDYRTEKADTLCAMPKQPARFSDAECNALTNPKLQAICYTEALKGYVAAQRGAATKDLKGTVELSLRVGKDGKITDVFVTKPATAEVLNTDAVRLTKAMPAWLPAEHKDQKVATVATLTLEFE